MTLHHTEPIAIDPIVTELDAVRLARVLGRGAAARGPRIPARPFPDLDDKLENALIVAGREVAADIVTMNSTVRLRELANGLAAELTLVYPADATGAARISVLSPLGQALLGSRVGQVLELATPDGAGRSYRVEALLYQPEAAGHFDI